MTNLTVSFACELYDRTFPLLSGEVSIPGVNLVYLPQPVEETFWRQLRHQEYDVSELSLSSYLIATDRGTSEWLAIPVFPSRSFRHNCMFVHRDSGINRPEDLRGRRVGVPEYEITAAVWIRGLLADEYQVAPDSIEWFLGGEEQPGRIEKLPIAPPGVHLHRIAESATLSQLLLEGEIDAFIGAHTPSSFYHPSGRVRRLFTEPRRVEEAYFRKTGIFPIMHTVVVRRTLLQQHPWLAKNLFDGFSRAKNHALQRLTQTATATASMPWLYDDVERARAVMGQDWWPYGLEPNRHTLQTMIRYATEQGLISGPLTLESLFAPSTLDRGYAI